MGTERFSAGFLAPKLIPKMNALAARYPILDEERALWHALVGITELQREAFKTPLPDCLSPHQTRHALMYLDNTQDPAMRQIAEKLSLFREMVEIMRDRLHKPPEIVEAYEAGYQLLLEVAAHAVAHVKCEAAVSRARRK